MKKKFLTGLVIGLFILSATGIANALTLTFDTINTPGISLGGHMYWHGAGGGHVYNEIWNTDDFIIFDSGSTYVNDFQMNAMPWEGYTSGHIGNIDIAALDASDNTVWNTTVDLTDYTDWNDWFTVSVETDNVAQLYFTAPGNAPHFNGFWPSVDNLRIDENTNPVPEPATVLLLGIGLMGIAGSQFIKMKKATVKII